MKLLPPVTALLGRLHIRRATRDDIGVCDQIARQHPDALGWVRRDSLERALAGGTLLVAAIDGVVRAFVEYGTPSRGENAGYSVVYHLATARGWQGIGIGRQLLYAVPCPIKLKCLTDNRASCAFYRAAGFREIAQAVSKTGRQLTVFSRRVLMIWVQGNNRQIPLIAKQIGVAYGTRHDMLPRDHPFMVDIRWDKYDWMNYMDKIRRWRPVAAMVADYERPDQRDLMLQQVADLRAEGVLRIMVCPKFDSAIGDIPIDCTVAISVPSGYAGYMPPMRDLAGRSIHLLGGSPSVILDAQRKVAGSGGIVRSADANTQQRAAQYKTVWTQGKWCRTNLRTFSPQVGPTYEDAMRMSARNLARAWIIRDADDNIVRGLPAPKEESA